MIDSGGNLIEGSTKKDLVLASETGSLRRLLAASGLAFRVVSLNLELCGSSSQAGDLVAAPLDVFPLPPNGPIGWRIPADGNVADLVGKLEDLCPVGLLGRVLLKALSHGLWQRLVAGHFLDKRGDVIAELFGNEASAYGLVLDGIVKEGRDNQVDIHCHRSPC